MTGRDVRILDSCDHHDCTRDPTTVYAGVAIEDGPELYCYHPAYCDTHAAQLGEPDPQKVRVADVDST
jgi:hypothetical protein